MIRECVIICIIIVVILSANFFIISHLNESTDELVSKIDEINAGIDNCDDVNGLMEELSNKWDEFNNGWSTMVSHQELDQIELSLLSARIALQNDNLNDAVIELGKLQFLLQHINEKEAFKLKNIF